jgi:hypothetical protein
MQAIAFARVMAHGSIKMTTNTARHQLELTLVLAWQGASITCGPRQHTTQEGSAAAATIEAL